MGNAARRRAEKPFPFRGFLSIGLLALLTACHASNQARSVSAASSAVPLVIQTNLHGQFWTVSQIPTVSHVDDRFREACVRFDGDKPSLEGIDTACRFDESHEQILLNFGSHTIYLWADTQQGYRQHEDGRIIFLCDIHGDNRDQLKLMHNICVSRLSTMTDLGTQALASFASIPAALFGRQLFVVKVDTDAIIAAMKATDAVVPAHEAERKRILATIGSATSSAKELRAWSGSLSGFLAGEPDLVALINQQIAERESAEAQAVAEEAQARQREAAKQQELDRQWAAEQAAKQKQQIAQNHAQTESFRTSLKVGDQTHCGLVLSINGPVAVVQAMAPIGQYGLKIRQLYPPGLADCRFLNGVYQDPALPY